MPRDRVSLVVIPNITFSHRRGHLKQKGKFCSQLLSALSIPGVKVYCSFRLGSRVPTRPFSQGVSLVVARGRVL